MKLFVSVLMGILIWGIFPASATTDECSPGIFSGAFDGEVTVCQGWGPNRQQEFWFTGQGSNIIPYSWFLYPEQSNSAKLFRGPVNTNFYRFLPQGTSAMNPDGLPIGFTKDVAKGDEKHRIISQEWLGVTCAACHTGQLEYGGRKVLIDGAPAMADFQSYFEGMANSLRATLNNPAKLRKFGASVTEYNWNHSGGTTDEKVLMEQLVAVTESLEKRNTWNSGSVRFGNARLDALGSILNQVLVAHRMPLKEGLVSAPVSYPFIWDTPQLDRVQWNGSVVNAGLGALSRNSGEVIGVFGSLDPRYPVFGGTQRPDHQNSLDIPNLGLLEELVWELKSPQWKDVWENTDIADIDADLKKSGEDVYAEKCVRCHALSVSRDDRNFKVNVKMVRLEEIQTDSTAAVNFASRGKSVDPPDVSDGEKLTVSVVGALMREFLNNRTEMIKTIKAGQPPEIKVFIDQVAKNVLTGFEKVDIETKRVMVLKFLGAMKQQQNKWMTDKGTHCAETFLCYKARPLNGIWATGPYLHNGSVRTIRQLLIPGIRQETFNVGSRAYDPEGMGFKDEGNFVVDTTFEGNLNTGHDFFKDFFGDVNNIDKKELLGLLEYLKTL